MGFSRLEPVGYSQLGFSLTMIMIMIMILISVSFKNTVGRKNPVVLTPNNPLLNTMLRSGFLLNISKQVLSYFYQFHYHHS